MKTSEHCSLTDMNPKEASLAELLFLPKIKDAKQNNKTKKSGSRISKRLQKQQKEKEAALLLAGKSTSRFEKSCAKFASPALL